jgi:hypothetical protein
VAEATAFKNLENTNFSKNPSNPFWTKGWVVGEGQLLHWDFLLPGVGK